MKQYEIALRLALVALLMVSAGCTVGKGEGAEGEGKTYQGPSGNKVSEQNKRTDVQKAKEDVPGLTAVLNTDKGEIHLRLFAVKVPFTVANFVNLAQRGYYNGLTFHLVMPDFMIQSGCPLGNGRGRPGYKFPDEFVQGLRHDRPGILSMANIGPDTNGSQFFITYDPAPWLDEKHTVFGVVVRSGDQDVVNSIVQGDKIQSITVQGDTSALMKKTKEAVDAWNRILDECFPDLKKNE